MSENREIITYSCGTLIYCVSGRGSDDRIPDKQHMSLMQRPVNRPFNVMNILCMNYIYITGTITVKNCCIFL